MGCQNQLFWGPRGVIRRVWCFHRRGLQNLCFEIFVDGIIQAKLLFQVGGILLPQFFEHFSTLKIGCPGGRNTESQEGSCTKRSEDPTP